MTPGAIERTLEQKLPQWRMDHLTIPSPEGFNTPEGADQFNFVLKQLDVDGAHAIPAGEIEGLYAPLLGKRVSLAQMFEIARKITDLYNKHGYALSFALVPAQDLDPSAGKVRIDVVEGYVGEIRYEGDTARLPAVVRELGNHITRSRPLKTAVLERYLLLISDMPGYTASGVFDRIPDAPKGATRLVVKIAKQDYVASASVDDRGSRAFGPWQASATVSLNSLLGQGEQVMVHALRALNGKELTALVGRVSYPLNDDGLTLALNSTFSDGHPGSQALSAIHFASSGWTYGAQLTYPLLRSREQSLWVWGGFTGKALRSDFLAITHSRDHIFDLQAGATWNERDEGGLTALDATLTQGMPVFGATPTSSLLRSRSAGSAVFTALTATITRLQSAGKTEFGDIDAYAAASGQIASRGLLSPEQCGYGGGVFGRAYDANELVGDYCAFGSVELRFTPHIGQLNFLHRVRIDPARLQGYVNTLQFFAVADAGVTVNTGKLGFGDKSSETAATLGAGFRFTVFDHVGGSLEFDQPLGHRVALEGNRAGRVFFQISVSN